jgi:hypothetical protein
MAGVSGRTGASSVSTSMNRSLVGAAVRSKAEWCDAVCRSQGLTGEFGPQAWTVAARTPAYCPDAVTLVPGADAAAVVARLDTTRPGASLKDSFADLDLTGAGFRVLFEAQWIHRPAARSAPAPGSTSGFSLGPATS